MKKKIFFMSLVLLLAVFSCKNEDEALVPILKVDQTPLEFDKAGGEKSIPVKVNEGDGFLAVVEGGGAWVKLTQDKSGVTVKVSENTNVDSRSCNVKIAVSGLTITKDVEIKQSGVAPELELLPGEISVDQFGGYYVVDVKANFEGWEVTGAPEWAKVVAKVKAEEIRITFAENKDRKAREAELTISKGELSKTIKLNQSGIIYFIESFPKTGATFDEIEKFELGRKSVYDTKNSKTTVHIFKTVSPVSPTVTYNMTKEGKLLYTRVVTDATTYKDEELKPWFTSKGYEYAMKDERDGFEVYWNEEAKIVAKLIENSKGAFIDFYAGKAKPEAPQYKDQVTFDSIPYGFIEWGKTKTEIDAWEAQNGGVFNASNSSDSNWFNDGALWYDVKDSPIGRDLSIYWVKGTVEKGTYKYSSNIYSSLTKFFYKQGADAYISKEFKALLEKDGFKFGGYSYNYASGRANFSYTSETKNLGLEIASMKFGGKDIALLIVLPASGSSAGKGALLDNTYNLLLNKK